MEKEEVITLGFNSFCCCVEDESFCCFVFVAFLCVLNALIAKRLGTFQEIIICRKLIKKKYSTSKDPITFLDEEYRWYIVDKNKLDYQEAENH